MTDYDAHSPAERLRLWAQGLRPLEAAAWLLTHALDGRLLMGPWVRETPAGLLRIDPDVADAESGYLSGGERRVLAIAMSLISEDHPVDLGDAITGIGPWPARHVATALGHAAGLVDVASVSAPAPTDDEDEEATAEAALEALEDELNPVLESAIAGLQRIKTALDLSVDDVTEMVHERLAQEEGI